MSEHGMPWWQDAVVYQIYPWSFCLADPEGRNRRLGAAGGPVPKLWESAGDLEGIRRHLDHVESLGATALWLSPIFTSPMADFGYDVADYCDVSPLFGDLATFDALVDDAHRRGLRVLLDWVPNHTSSEHPWFRDARSSRSSEHRDWYVWRDPDPRDPDSPPSRPPNNWRRAFGEGPAWTFDEATGQWYLHLFLPEQPDLNWANPAVVDAMGKVLDFWLARGVDGFRIDVVHGLGKPEGLPDVPEDLAGIPYSALNDDPSTHAILRRLRSQVDRWPQQPVLVGEVFLLDTGKVAPYYGRGDELHLAFNFAPMFSRWSAGSFRRRLAEIERELGPRDAWPTWVLSSHDRPRHRTRYGGSERRARAAAVLTCGMRGTLFLYAGEELGLEDAEVPDADRVDPGGRDGCRAPIPWTPAPPHGWALARGARPWLPWPPGASEHNAESESGDPASVLSLYRRLFALRHRLEVLRRGDLELCDVGDGEVLAFRRARRERARAFETDTEALVLVNFADRKAATATPGNRWRVAVSSAGAGSLCSEGTGYAERLGPEEAVILVR